MKPQNSADITRSRWTFFWLFIGLLVFLFFSSFAAIKTAGQGVYILQDRYDSYQSIFEKQVSYNFELDEIVNKIHDLKNNQRSLNERKELQSIVTDLRKKIEIQLSKDSLVGSKKDHYLVYKDMLKYISDIQSTLDQFQKQEEDYAYKKDLLKKCSDKYTKNLKNE